VTDIERSATAALIARHPLAWVVSRGFNASVLPLLGEYDAAGTLTSVIGHCGRANPLVEDLARDPAGLILFNGPAGYIPTRFVSKTDWAPTWNFAVLRLEVDILFLTEETGAFVDRLLDHLEGKTAERWSVRELGDRYAQMLDRIIGFRATVRSVRPHFKLGQDESAATFGEIVEHMPGSDLGHWMQAFARGETP
jgi:transcriptional regulator